MFLARPLRRVVGVQALGRPSWSGAGGAVVVVSTRSFTGLNAAVQKPTRSLRDSKVNDLRKRLAETDVTTLSEELDEMMKNGQRPPPKRFTFIMRRATKGGSESGGWPRVDMDLAESVFRKGLSLYRGNNYLWAEMISCCTRCKRTDVAQRVYEEWHRMREERQMDGGLIVMEAMIAHYTALKDPQSVATIYEQIRRMGLVPSAYAASSLVTSFCKFGEYEKAISIAQQAGNDSWMAMNTVLNYLCRDGRMDEGIVVLQDATNLGFEATIETYNNLLRAAAYSGQRNAIDVVLERMKQSKTLPNEQTYRMILIGFAYAPNNVQLNAEEIRGTFQEAKRVATHGVPDARTSAAAVLAFLRCGNDVNNAVSILRKEILQRDTTFVVPFAVWDRLIECYERQFDNAVWRRKSNRREACEGAYLKVFRWLKEAYARERVHSEYVNYRWRRASTQLLGKLKNLDNVERIYEDVITWRCFVDAKDEGSDIQLLTRTLLGKYLDERNLDRALQMMRRKHKEFDFLISDIQSYVLKVIRERNANETRHVLHSFLECCRELGIEPSDKATLKKTLAKHGPSDLIKTLD